MNKKAVFVMILIVALIIGLSVYTFYKTHEQKEVTVRTGLLSEARRNPLYAGRLFLQRMGIPAASKNSVKGFGGNFPDTNTVIVIVTKRSSFSENHTEELLDWVRSGGHLIARSVDDWNYADTEEDDYDEDENEESESRDPLQQLLGISTGDSVSFDYDPEEKEDEDKENSEDNTNYEYDDETTLGKILDFFTTTADDRAEHTIHLKGVNEPLKIQTSGFNPLIVADEYVADTEQVKINNNNFMVRQKVGKGLVTLISDLRFIKNYHLEKSDHAEIFWHLIHGKHASLQQPKDVWLIHNGELPNLLDLIWKYAWTFMLSLLMLFIAWLMLSTRRFGPLIPKLEENRRSLKEHITSSGNFYWKNNNKQKLIDSSRNALKQRLAQVHPGWAQRSEAEQVKLLAEQVSMTPIAIERLLFAPNIENPDDFVQLIRQLERIRHQI